MKILVFGAGAIGLAFGGFLSREHEVALVGRRSYLDLIRKGGLRVTGIWGRHTFRSFALFEDAEAVRKAGLKFDLILVTVKSYDTQAAALALKKNLSPETIVLSLQNGLGNIETLEKYLPRPRILAGRVIFGVELKPVRHGAKAAEIKVTVCAQPTAVGEVRGKKITPRVRRIVRAMARAGIPAVTTHDVRRLLWAKVVYNSALNPLASLMDCHYGALGEDPSTRLAMDRVITEVYAVATRAGLTLKPSRVEAYRRFFYGKLLPKTYYHHPSMLQDLKRGKRTEIESLNGEVARIGKRYGVPTPVNEWLAELIRKKEKVFSAPKGTLSNPRCLIKGAWGGSF
ncbi:MAG: ketopantoate reductase family protein [Candidatus Omnitrophota bacterium]